MHRLILVLSLTLAFSACAPSISTTRADMPSMPRGPLNLVVTSEGTVPPEELAKAKIQLKRSFREAGFDPVETGNTGQGKARAIEIALTKYEQSTPSKNPAVAAGVGCVYVCPLLAPCLLLPIYYEPQFEITADVTLYNKGQRSFGVSLSERAVSSANLVETGNEQFREKLEELAVHNFTAALMGRMGGQGPPVRARLP